MNKPAPKEPSMDEILSSIRQIIADDDAAGVQRKPLIQAAPDPMPANPALSPFEERRPEPAPDPEPGDALDDAEPLALSPAQIVRPEPEEASEGPSFADILADTEAEAPPPLVDPDDVAFDAGEDDEAGPDEPPPVASGFAARSAERESSKAPPHRSHSPLPDPTLSQDMAERLLEPATNAAVRSTFSKLNNLGLGTQGLTIEAMVRDMLRPMLKEWLDENLPTVVERMVEKEIARISRGE